MIHNGQQANQTNFNAAFVSRTDDTSTAGKLALQNTDTASGDSVPNPQKEVNGLNVFTGRPSDAAKDAKPVWDNNDVGADTDDLKTRADLLTAEFNPSTGHTHNGTDSAPLAATALNGVVLRGYYRRGVNLTGVTGSSVVVTTQLAGKTESSGDTVKGVVTTALENKVPLLSLNTGSKNDALKDAAGNLIYGRLTKSGSVWTLSFYVDLDGTETAHSFGGATNIAWFYQELFNPITDAPVYSELAKVPSDNATQDVVDMIGTDGMADGARGLVPAPLAADVDKFLSALGTWETPSGGGITIVTADPLVSAPVVFTLDRSFESEVGATLTLTDPDGVGTVVLTEGIDWTRSVGVSADAASLKAAMDAAFTGWTITRSVGHITMTRNIDGPYPAVSLVYSASAWLITETDAGADASPDGMYLNKNNGKLFSVTAGVPTLEYDFRAAVAEYDAGTSGTAKTIDWDNGPSQKLSMTGNCTLTLDNPKSGETYQLKLTQDGTGTRVLTLPAGVKTQGGAAIVLSTTAGAVDILSLYYDGTNYFAVLAADWS